ncbi:Glycosyl transferase family 2 [Xaviernesmea oryzae]|uniref:Glycosyl transferase family 2 n=1 Tax=Xaviernesmea oryzae TaxID=464029 RepID=A0A1X7FS66_9HYPH|nr:glycosyltransferase family A protein [Xaviernesmea oryzae]SMF57822.1 Glycosyl transferase family 2 [Xaviernesmea oryzae]
MTLASFRRFPLRRIRRWRPQPLGEFSARIFEKLDRRGILSDLCADPQRLYEVWWPYKFIRRNMFDARYPLVSVIVATRNNEETIERALRSLMEQTLHNLEIIVINDASTDRTASIVERLAQEDKRIRILHNVHRLGTGRSRNRGLAAATGDYVTFQDGDDNSAPSRLEMQVNAFRKFRQKKLVLCNYVRVAADGTKLQVNDSRVMKCIISMMFPRKETLEKVGYFLEEEVGEDADYYERIKIAFGDECEILVFRTLYQALFRPESSFFGTTEIHSFDGRKLSFKRRAEATERWEQFRARHRLMREGRAEIFVPHIGARE